MGVNRFVLRRCLVSRQAANIETPQTKNVYISKMNTTYAEEWPQFYTATILHWQHLLKDDKCKDIIIESLQFLTKQKRITLYGFAPIAIGVSNHIHLLWQPMAGHTISSVQSSFMKYTAHQFKRYLQKTDAAMLENYKVDKHDREYQF